MKSLGNVYRQIMRFFVRKIVRIIYLQKILKKYPWTITIYLYLYRLFTLSGLYEPGTIKLVKKILRPGMTFVDLGANKGYYSILASKLVGDKGRVFAFEPDSDIYSMLEVNLKGKRNVKAINKAVSDYTGSTRLYLSDSNPASNSIYYGANEGTRSMCVEVTSLDAFFENTGIAIDIVKMDIQGAEMSAVNGGHKLIESTKEIKIITELDPDCARAAGYSPEDFLSKLTENGFKTYVIDTGGGLKEIENELPNLLDDMKKTGYVNLYCEK